MSGGTVVVNQPSVTPRTDAGVEIDFATETKLEAVRVLLAALAAEDFATEVTLDAFLTAFNNEDFASQATLDALLTAFNNEDFATQTTLNSLLTAFNAEDFATQTTLATRASEATVATLLTNTQLRASAVPVSAASLPLPAGAATQATLATRASEATLATRLTEVTGAAIQTILTAIRDTAGIKKITDGVLLQAGANQVGLVAQGTKGALANAWPTVPTDAAGNAYSSSLDVGVRRLEISGKVQVTGAAPPPATTAATIYASSPLSVGSHDTDFIIPNGKTFFLQEIVAGNEDPTKGCVVEVLYFNGAEHLIGREYRAGVTQTTGYPSLGKGRDGTASVGNGTTFKIIVRRTKYSGSDINIDAIARGYTV